MKGKLVGFISALLTAAVLLISQMDHSLAQSEEAFLPTWKLLTPTERQHFIAGYLQGWTDAQKVTDVAIGFIRENPEKAVESLQSIGRLYDVTSLRAPALVKEIDEFYSDTDNHNASLSKAVTAAKASLRQAPIPE